MNEDLLPIVEAWENLMADGQRYAYMSRAIELQRDAIERLESFHRSLVDRKREAQQAGAEDDANLLLALGSLVSALGLELAMFVALKEERPGDAWDHLITAQVNAIAGLRAHGRVAECEPYVELLLQHERSLFPKQLFLSPGMVVGESECSICASPYGECIHVAGRAYMGEFCARVITEVARLDEVSVVEEPKDKRRRIVSITDDEGVERDFLSWRPRHDAESGES